MSMSVGQEVEVRSRGRRGRIVAIGPCSGYDGSIGPDWIEVAIADGARQGPSVLVAPNDVKVIGAKQ